MGRKTKMTSLESMSEPSLTPLMDLSFILLITFIIAFPLIEQAIPINLPVAKGNELTQTEATHISIDETGTYFLNEKEMTYDELSSSLMFLGQNAPETAVMLRADQALPYADVVAVIHLLKQAKLTKMGLVTQEPGGN